MSASKFIQEYRRCRPALPGHEWLSQVAYSKAIDKDGDDYDANALFRGAVCTELYHSLEEADREFVRYLLEQEILGHRDCWGIGGSIQLCAFMLFKLGHIEDVPLIWKAKGANFDTFSGIDVQLLVGGGMEETLRYLKQQGDKDSLDAAQYIGDCVAAGDFKNMDNYLSRMERYFRSRA